MRDPQRISELLALIQELWEKDADLRFNQLIYNLQYEYAKTHDNYGLVEQKVDKEVTKTAFDFFYLEDDDFIEFLASFENTLSK